MHLLVAGRTNVLLFYAMALTISMKSISEMFMERQISMQFNLLGIKRNNKVIHLQQIYKITPTNSSEYKIGDALHE
ncbi:unnamed protein product [Gulo gulo]|uniref:Uncharacterized protein n=1 Tax=Gulo gulo TaxID=48420 RepID=A0A9X9Q3U8_GULGU|nr:unnamed protein product [Gulo gulo]